MEHQQNINGLVRLREMRRQADLYASDPEKTEQDEKIVKGKLANHFRNRAKMLRLMGNAYTEWVEDIASEGLCLAMKAFPKWQPERGPFWNWVFLHARSFGTRWMDRFERKYGLLEELASQTAVPHGASYLRESVADDTGSVRVRISVEQLIAAELSETQQTMLKLVVQGYSVKEISELEGYSPGTVQRYINRAQDKARTVAQRYGFEGLRVNQRPKQREPASTPFLPTPAPQERPGDQQHEPR